MAENKKALALVAALLIVGVLFIARAIVVGVYHIRMADAIYVYHLDCMAHGKDAEVWWTDKESFEDTFRRWWDWSDHHILPEEKDRLIRPYIGEDFEEWERRTN